MHFNFPAERVYTTIIPGESDFSRSPSEQNWKLCISVQNAKWAFYQKKKKKDVGFVLKSTLKPSTSLHLEAINKKQRRS